MKRFAVVAGVVVSLAFGWSAQAVEAAATVSGGALDARQALDAQTRAFGGTDDVIAMPSHASLRDAVGAYLANKGALTPAVEARLVVLDSVPAARQAALARVVDAFVAFDAAAARRIELARTQGLTAGLAGVLSARAALFDAATALPAPGDLTTMDAGPLEVSPWLSLSMGVHDNVYTSDFALVIDEGGNDLYLNNAGGSNLVGGSLCELAAVIPSPAAALIDQGGADRYWSGRSCGVNGGGAAMRAGSLFDLGPGDDSYLAGDFGVNGGGDFGGVGLLYDQAGNSSYSGGKNGVNGGGSLGVGLLIDEGGADSYFAADNGVNGGSQFGVAGLLDRGGSDRYEAGDIGTNGGANGGSGYLVDQAGNDTYIAGTTGVNGGGSAGTGLLLDQGGTDNYTDGDGGTGINKRIVPKGVVGAQFDV